MWFVKKSEILSLIPIENLDDLLQIFSDHQNVKKNTMIYQPEDPSDYVYLIKKGSVRLMRLADSGQQITLSIVKEGMIFGEGDVLNEKTYSHYAETIENSSICYIHKSDFKDLLKKYEEVNKLILNILYRRWREAQQQIENLAFHDVRQRLISILRRFSNDYGQEYNQNGLNGTLINVKVSQDKLADFCGTSRESINRTMKEMKSEGLLDMVGRNILLKPDFFITHQDITNKEKALTS
ncbi:Crp/Fnr family transcriptional regulator [Ferviditalea candida]|uniref:Crp/Fnr family transcriptional regulator n=1 Tax=Ferviditalea candida TaxID=3108399 RepID=A0ABU5ZCS9_9BACL|nr:Crp/Fnr family transcriptional regulator [Paenibacillaceae bacterium T2]